MSLKKDEARQKTTGAERDKDDAQEVLDGARKEEAEKEGKFHSKPHGHREDVAEESKRSIGTAVSHQEGFLGETRPSRERAPGQTPVSIPAREAEIGPQSEEKKNDAYHC